MASFVGLPVPSSVERAPHAVGHHGAADGQPDPEADARRPAIVLVRRVGRRGRRSVRRGHRTSRVVTHFVCMTPGRFGPISRIGKPWSRSKRLAVDLHGQQRVAGAGLVLVQHRLAVEPPLLEPRHRHRGPRLGAGHLEQVAHPHAAPPLRGAPPLDAGDRQRRLVQTDGTEVVERQVQRRGHPAPDDQPVVGLLRLLDDPGLVRRPVHRETPGSRCRGDGGPAAPAPATGRPSGRPSPASAARPRLPPRSGTVAAILVLVPLVRVPSSSARHRPARHRSGSGRAIATGRGGWW